MGKSNVLTRSVDRRRGAAVSLDSFRLMQRPELRKLTSSEAAVLRCADASRRQRLKTRRRKGKMKKGCLTLFIRKGVIGGREKQGGQRMII